MGKRALVLFAHGSRDARWAQPFLRLQDMLRAQMPDVAVELAFLELMAPRLPELIGKLAGEGVDAVTVVPVFLGQGGHVLRDLPILVEDARVGHPGIRITLAEAAGESEAVLRAIAAYCTASLDG
jgi:sirohydrochlorin cobaltochelatase